MKNPYQDARELKMVPWLWKTNKWDLLGVTVGTLIIMILLISIDPVDTWWGYGIIMPLWYVLHVIRWAVLYKRNVKSYHNWEETYYMLKDK